MNAIDPELEVSSDSCELWGWICGGLVVAALIAEVVLAYKNPPYGAPLERLGALFTDATIALGVAGEVMFARMGHKRDGELKRRAALEIARLKDEAAQANNRALQARLELERLKKPRSIDHPAQQRVAGKVDRFAGTPFIFTVLANDPEAAALLEQLTTTLAMAGWEQIAWKDLQGNDVQLGYTLPGRPLCGLNNLIGLYVQADMGKERQYRLPVAALTSALMDEGLEAKAEIGAMPDKMDKTVIHIQIGKKPL
jgi:hypothetical protein